MVNTILKRIEASAKFFPKRPAIILPDRMINYEMLLGGIFSVQAIIHELRLTRDLPVGLLVDNPIRHIIIFLALMRSGITVTSMRREHIDENNVNNQIVITDHDHVFGPVKVVSVRDDWFTKSNVDTFGELPFENNRIARIYFTSGSTGYPKAIGCSFAAIHKRIEEIQFAGIGSGDRFLITYGLSNAALKYALKTLADAKTLVFSKIEDALDMVLTYGIDEIRCSAVQAEALIKVQKEFRYPVSIKTISTGGGRLLFETANMLRQLFGCEIINTLISTEGGLVALARGDVLSDRQIKGNCFLPMATVEVLPLSDRPDESEGRIRIQSNSMAWPFTGNLTETDEVKGDGWFYPGDLGYIDHDGLLILTGRIDEVINIGGVKFAPEVVEEKLKAHPELDDVAVVRVTFDGNITHPCIAIVSAANITLDELNNWLPNQLTGELRTVQFHKMIKVDAIPKTGTGKIARNEIRKLFQQ